VWSASEQPSGSRTAAIIQGCIWTAFFSAMLVPQASLADPGRELAPIAGIELNLFGAVLHVLLLVSALTLLQRSARSRP
jgi:hypothetical protein